MLVLLHRLDMQQTRPEVLPDRLGSPNRALSKRKSSRIKQIKSNDQETKHKFDLPAGTGTNVTNKLNQTKSVECAWLYNERTHYAQIPMHDGGLRGKVRSNE